MKKVIIFGCEQTSQLANYYLTQTTSDFEVVAFTVNKEFRKYDNYCDKPVVDFETIQDIYPPSEYCLFAPMTGKGLNKIREKIYNQGKDKGYTFISYISKYATVLTEDIGENCFILEDNTIQPFVKIGNNCVLWSGNHVGHHSIIEDHVFIASCCVISGNCLIKSYSWLGVNCTLRNALTIGTGTLVAMSASVTKNTDEYTVYMGVPAKPFGRSDEEKVSMSL